MHDSGVHNLARPVHRSLAGKAAAMAGRRQCDGGAESMSDAMDTSQQ